MSTFWVVKGVVSLHRGTYAPDEIGEEWSRMQICNKLSEMIEDEYSGVYVTEKLSEKIEGTADTYRIEMILEIESGEKPEAVIERLKNWGEAPGIDAEEIVFMFEGCEDITNDVKDDL